MSQWRMNWITQVCFQEKNCMIPWNSVFHPSIALYLWPCLKHWRGGRSWCPGLQEREREGSTPDITIPVMKIVQLFLCLQIAIANYCDRQVFAFPVYSNCLLWVQKLHTVQNHHTSDMLIGVHMFQTNYHGGYCCVPMLAGTQNLCNKPVLWE